jgi:type II secretory pathway pseudopilin PulG
MNRIVVYFLLPFVVAAASAINIVAFWLSNLLRPSWPMAVTTSIWASAVAILVFAGVAFGAASRTKRVRRSLLALSLVVIVAAGFVPRAVDFYDQAQLQAQEQMAGADAEMEFQSAYLDRSDDVDQRIADKQPFTPDEALEFLDFAAHADLSWRSLPDHTPEAFALVEQAIEGGILDPNALTTTAPTADSPAVTVTLAYYDKAIRPASPRAIEKHAWDVLQILVAHGADVSSPDATQLRGDLARTVVLGEGRYISLK